MPNPRRALRTRDLAAALCLSLAGFPLSSQPPAPVGPGPAHQETMNMRASGPFDPKLTQQPAEPGADPTIGRWTIDKQFHGGLEATSKGQMLAVQSDVKGSAGYVALERVTGTLDGRSGAFTLQHSGTMTRGTPHLEVAVVPDSATGQLTGLTGTMTIEIAGGKHSYVFEYSLPAAP